MFIAFTFLKTEQVTIETLTWTLSTNNFSNTI